MQSKVSKVIYKVKEFKAFPSFGNTTNKIITIPFSVVRKLRIKFFFSLIFKIKFQMFPSLQNTTKNFLFTKQI